MYCDGNEKKKAKMIHELRKKFVKFVQKNNNWLMKLIKRIQKRVRLGDVYEHQLNQAKQE